MEQLRKYYLITLFSGFTLSFLFFSGTLQGVTSTESPPPVDYESLLNQKNAEIQSLKEEIQRVNESAEFYKTRYEYLIRTNITKEDVESIEGNLSQVNIYVNNTFNEITSINKNINEILAVTNKFVISYYLNFAFSVSIAIIFVLDVVFNKFEFTKGFFEFLFSLPSKIKEKFRRKRED